MDGLSKIAQRVDVLILNEESFFIDICGTSAAAPTESQCPPSAN